MPQTVQKGSCLFDPWLGQADPGVRVETGLAQIAVQTVNRKGLWLEPPALCKGIERVVDLRSQTASNHQTSSHTDKTNGVEAISIRDDSGLQGIRFNPRGDAMRGDRVMDCIDFVRGLSDAGQRLRCSVGGSARCLVSVRVIFLYMDGVVANRRRQQHIWIPTLGSLDRRCPPPDSSEVANIVGAISDIDDTVQLTGEFSVGTKVDAKFFFAGI